MELRNLVAFEAVARLGSFTRAADELSLTQPAITRQVAALEAELRTRLMDRLGRRVALTAAGEVLMRYAVDILRLGEEASRAVADVATGAGGRLAIGASSTTATYFLPPVLRRFREARPGVELSVHTGPSAQIAEMVANNGADIGVVTRSGDSKDLIEIGLTEYATGVVVYPGHPLASRGAAGPITPAELSGSPLILMEQGTNLRTYADRLLSAAGVQEQIPIELDNVEAIKKMIEARLGISLLPMLSVQAEVAAGRLVALALADPPGARRRISAIYRRDKYLTAAMQAFVVLLQEESA